MGNQVDELEGRANELLEMIDEMKARSVEIIAEARKAREADNQKFKTELSSMISSMKGAIDSFQEDRKRLFWNMIVWAIVAGMASGVVLLIGFFAILVRLGLRLF